MYLNPHEAIELLQITTRQGLHKIVTNHNITVKSQGAGKPNLYLKADLDRYKIDNKKNLKNKDPKVTEKAVKIKKAKVDRVKKAKAFKKKVSEELSIPMNQVDELSQEEHTPPQKPVMPSDEELKNPLNHIGQSEFNRIIDIMTENGTYKEQDRALVLSYAISYQKYVYAVAASAMEDDTTMDQFGNLKLHPYFIVSDKCLTQMTKIANVLGIGVRSRIGIEMKKEKKETIFDILNQKEEF